MLPSKMLKSQEKKSTFLGNIFNKIAIFPKRYRFLEKKEIYSCILEVPPVILITCLNLILML